MKENKKNSPQKGQVQEDAAMQLLKKSCLLSLVALVLAVFCNLLSINPASAMPSRDSVPPAPNQPANNRAKAKNITKIDPAKIVVPQILPPGLLPEFPHPWIPRGYEPVQSLSFTTLEFKVEAVEKDGKRFKVATFTDKGKRGKGDGFLVEFDTGAYLNSVPAPKKQYLLFQSGQLIPELEYTHTLRIQAAAKGQFSVYDAKFRCAELKTGYVVGEAVYEEKITKNGHVLHSADVDPESPVRIVKESEILRRPRMVAVENPPRPFWLHNQPTPTGPYFKKKSETPDYPQDNSGLWIQAWRLTPDRIYLFDVLLLSYLDTSNMEFGGAPGNVGSDAIGIGMANFILKVPVGSFKAWVEYFPGDINSNILYIRATIVDHSPEWGNEGRYIVANPTLTRLIK